jgi:hypothetical protein
MPPLWNSTRALLAKAIVVALKPVDIRYDAPEWGKQFPSRTVCIRPSSKSPVGKDGRLTYHIIVEADSEDDAIYRGEEVREVLLNLPHDASMAFKSGTVSCDVGPPMIQHQRLRREKGEVKREGTFYRCHLFFTGLPA